MPPAKKTTAKPRAKKPDPDAAPIQDQRSSLPITEVYQWTARIVPQGESMRYLQVTANDGRMAFRMMNIDQALAEQLAGMLVPDGAEPAA